jgi:2-C-methyl-D-erythritol 4-phosphate cytidylyltransferase
MIIVHDAARPFVDPVLVSRVLKAAVRYGAALAAIPVQDTVKQASREGTVAGTVDRSSLWLAQTPQAFRAELIREAHRQARGEGFRGTDDASLVEKYGHPVFIVPGSPLNMKITTPEDIVLARALAATR